jgi:DNA repair exonuclease SbcCD ATPase subunit
MQREYERTRILAQVEQLKREKEQLHHSITHTERDEEFQVERLQREFKGRIEGMKTRQTVIEQELRNLDKSLKQIEMRLREVGGGTQESSINTAREERRRQMRLR